MVAACYFFVYLHQRDTRREDEFALVRTDPIAAAEQSFKDGDIYFYHWQHEQGLRDENGELSRELVWSVMAKGDTSPLLLGAISGTA